MGNTENLENTENVENLEAQLPNGGEPEDTEEVIANREKALKEVAEYYKLLRSGEYNVRMLDPNTEVAVQPLTVQPEDEALLKTYFQLKALQNSGNISTLSWNSSGNKGNLYADADEWDRIGVSCCADGTSETPGFVYSYSEHILDSSDTHGNKNFKAVMIKADYQVIVPAYSEVTLNVTMNIHVFKRGGETSASWLGACISNKSTWTTINDDNDKNNQWANNNGVIKTNNSADCTLASDDSKKVNLRLSLNNYNCGTQKNTSNTAKLWTFTLYVMGSIEKANSINHRVLLFDRIEDKFDAKITGKADITYDPAGGAMMNGYGTTQQISFESGYDTEISLYKAERPGYVLAGWKDEATGRIYPAGGTYTEWRGMKLTAQWIPDKVDCRIEHYQQGLDGNYPGTPTEFEILKTLAGKTITPDRKNYEGFTAPAAAEVKPDADGTTVVKYNYKRNSRQLVFCANGGMFIDENGNETDFIRKVYYPGANIQYPKLKQRYGYSFAGWTDTLSTMPDRDVIILADWQANDQKGE